MSSDETWSREPAIDPAYGVRFESALPDHGRVDLSALLKPFTRGVGLWKLEPARGRDGRVLTAPGDTGAPDLSVYAWHQGRHPSFACTAGKVCPILVSRKRRRRKWASGPVLLR